jgi:DNA-binding protein H-NS
MSKIDLSGLTVAELRNLLEEVKAQLEKSEEEERRQAFEAIVEAAKKVGLAPKDLLRRYGQEAPAAAAPAKEAPAAAYRNPANPAETWTGRGRKPRWVTEWLDAGKNIEELQAGK